MVQLFGELRTRFGDMAPPAPSPPGWAPRLPPLDQAPELVPIVDPEAIAIGHGIRGLSLILDYVDAQQSKSTRQVSCSRLVHEYGQMYLRAFCHQRRAPRQFHLGRIAGVYDIVTGELLGTGAAFFEAHVADRTAVATGEWGLLPVQREALGAGLIVLTFLSRCDGECHPLERDEIEAFATSWWIRAEIATDFPEEQVATRARRLAPDVEVFEAAARMIRHDRTLRPMVAGYARQLIAADGRIAAAEHDWIATLIRWWEED